MLVEAYDYDIWWCHLCMAIGMSGVFLFFYADFSGTFVICFEAKFFCVFVVEKYGLVVLC